MAHPAYGADYQRRRRALLAARPWCAHCAAEGRRTRATEADHDPPLVLHRHVERSGCCRLVATCATHARAQGAALQYQGDPEANVEVALPEPVGLDVGDSAWDVDWLEALREVPVEGTWPRFMTAPHPSAVGSHGAAAAGWLATEAGIELRWWQRLALVRQLEHDEAGALVWLDVLLTTARQVGKSTLVRGGATWRLHQGERFGEPQTIVHTGKDLPICNEVQKLARAWARARGYPVREQNGNEQITEPESGSRWLVRGKKSVYGYSASVGLVDEAWGVAPDIVEDGLEETMIERVSPQLILASTAHRLTTPLFPARRTAALDELAVPGSTLLVEWSAERDVEIDDREAWRRASPQWSAVRERFIASRLARVLAGVSLDPDEGDPVESFRAQILNIWPAAVTSRRGSETLVSAEAWARCEGALAGAAAGWVAVEADTGDSGAAVAVVAQAEHRFEVDGLECASWAEAMLWVRKFAELLPGSGLIAGASMMAQVPADMPGRALLRRSGGRETALALPLLRSLVAEGRVVHDRTEALDCQIEAARVKTVRSGLVLVPNERADLLRAVLWALWAAQEPPPLLSVR